MTQPAPSTAPPSSSGSSTVVKVLLIFLVLIILFVLAGLAGCVYLGYRAKKKADEIRQAYNAGDLDKLAGAVGVGKPNDSAKSSSGGVSASRSAPLSFPAWTPSSTGTASTRIPLVPGLTALCAVAQFGGDYQSVMQILEVTSDSVKLSIRADNVPNPLLDGLQKLSGEKKKPEASSIRAQRVVQRDDMRTAHELQEWFSPNHPDVFPGTTAVSVSREVLAELKDKGETSFTFGLGGLKGLMGSVVNPLGQLPGGLVPKETTDMGKAACTLKRVGEVAFPVLLNDQRVSLRALHAQCKTEDGLADFYFLDDLDNPANLAFKLGDNGDAVQVISISYPKELAKPPAESRTGLPAAASGGSHIEQELEQNGKAEIYGIYFDFGSDKIKPESEPVLKEIAAALEHNPSWKLRVEGHTDNIGGDDYNMDLSQRRAAAVKRALVTRYHIVEDRLAPEGFGATRPKESNETIAGRARNRRVELVRT